MYNNDAQYYLNKILNSVKSITLPEDLTLLTVQSGNNFTSLITLLDHYKVPYVNGAEDFKGEWDYTTKVKLVTKALDKITTKYVLILDADNTLILPDVEDILNRFKTKNKDILFSATANRFPSHTIDVVTNRDELGKFSWLSSGMVVGKTDNLKDFYNKADIIIEYYPDMREQEICRVLFNYDQEHIGFNYETDIFYTLSMSWIEEKEDKIIFN
jgi:hypothetical protein